MLYSGSLPREFEISQGTGQGRILAPFMYEVYVNGLLNSLTRHSCAISLNNVRLSSPSFADDISLLALHPTFLSTFMKICYHYSIKWQYEFSHIKTDVVTFGETKCVHCEVMKERSWILGNESVDEIYKYKNLGIAKNSSFSSNVDENEEKTRKRQRWYSRRTLTVGKLTL